MTISSPDYEGRVRTWMDMPNFLRPIVTHHICSSWDSYPYERGKNMYAYKPEGQPWRLLLWDIELALGAGDNAAIPSNGFALVWCDNQTNQTTDVSLHTAFEIAAERGTVALTRMVGDSVKIVDYLNYADLPLDWSCGDVPDGQPFYRQTMFFTTPGGTNNGALAPLTVWINEWLADNVSALADPADGNFEDWFELFNPGTDAVDLGGCYLTENLTNAFQFRIPDHGQYVVPAGGYLLVWADNEDSQNSTNCPDLHVNFALGKGGNAIGLFAADGTAIDTVTFGAQIADVTTGRFPDGAPDRYTLDRPTPRAANVITNSPANTAPALAVLTNRVVTLGQTLAFNATAAELRVHRRPPPTGADLGVGSGPKVSGGSRPRLDRAGVDGHWRSPDRHRRAHLVHLWNGVFVPLLLPPSSPPLIAGSGVKGIKPAGWTVLRLRRWSQT